MVRFVILDELLKLVMQVVSLFMMILLVDRLWTVKAFIVKSMPMFFFSRILVCVINDHLFDTLL